MVATSVAGFELPATVTVQPRVTSKSTGHRATSTISVCTKIDFVTSSDCSQNFSALQT